MEYAIVDIETTGSFAGGNNITEIAIIIHDGKQVIQEFQTLVNPESFIPFHIQTLTGITNEMVEDAPTFKQIAAQVLHLLDKRIFVAHNVNFDYSFIVEEFKAAGYAWKAQKLCTVRLSRKIIPNLASYSLGKLCLNIGIPIFDRHRAMGDAKATAILFEKLLQEDQDQIIESALKKSREQRLPTNINEEDFFKLPETAGIYIFRNKAGKIIYVGKAVNIRKRVLSHFTGNNSSQKRQSFINDISSIDFEESGTELMALLMECQMIKQEWPIHNKSLKRFEPKFALIQYEDQHGYIRLLVSPFNKHANVIQHFERAHEANQLLLKIIEDFELDPKLCSFFSSHVANKGKIDYDQFQKVDEYNLKINQAIDFVLAQRNTFLLIDQGRSLDEKSYIYFKDDQLYAFGFLELDYFSNDIESLISSSDRCTSNYYMNSLVLQYAERFPSKINFLKKA